MPIPVGYTEHIETPHGRRHIEAVWSYAATTSGQSLVLPDGRCDIILRSNAANPHAVTPVITGPATRAYTVTFEPGDQWLGIRMRPAYGRVLWCDQLGHARDAVLHGPDALALVPALAGLTGAKPTFETLAQIMPQLNADPRDDRVLRALNTLHFAGGRIRIAQLAQYAACSVRHLNRLFRESVGLSAKTYGQLVQFHRALRLITHDQLPVSAAAFEAGYADHAHLARAFRRFGGFRPARIPAELSMPRLFG